MPLLGLGVLPPLALVVIPLLLPNLAPTDVLILLSPYTHCSGLVWFCWAVPTWGFVDLAAPFWGLVANFLLFPSLAQSGVLVLFSSQTHCFGLVWYSDSSAVPLWWLGVLPHLALVVLLLLYPAFA